MELDLEMLHHDAQNAHVNSQSSLLINKKVWSRRYFALDPGSLTGVLREAWDGKI